MVVVTCPLASVMDECCSRPVVKARAAAKEGRNEWCVVACSIQILLIRGRGGRE